MQAVVVTGSAGLIGGEASRFSPGKGFRVIGGDFDGDGQKEIAFVIKVKEGNGNPVEDGIPDEYTINSKTKGRSSYHSSA